MIRLLKRSAVKFLTSPAFWLISVSLTLLCFLSGPFGTLAMPGGLRFIYWGLTVVSTALLGCMFQAFLRLKGWNRVYKTGLTAVVFGACVSGIVLTLHYAFLNPVLSGSGTTGPEPPVLLMYSFPSAVLIFLTLHFFSARHGLNTRHGAASRTDPPLPSSTVPFEPPSSSPNRPALLNRLEKYRDARRVLMLHAQDHYVEVTTELGAELCLIRFSDAIAETEPTPGVQIHRSYWVALAHIKKTETQTAPPRVVLHDGQVLKVSRSRLKNLKHCLSG